jgi:hypothetical protein
MKKAHYFTERMKSYKIMLTVFILSIGPSQAQIFQNAGLQAGVNFTRLEWKYRPSSSEKEVIRRSRNISTGYHIYLTSNLLAEKHFDLTSSLGWIQKHGIFSEQPAFADADLHYRLNYLSFISAVSGKLSLSRRLSGTAELGPRVEYLLNANNQLTDFSPNDDSIYYYYEDEDINRWSIGLVGGVGIKYKKDNLTIGLKTTRNLNINEITDAKGPRKDGLGDEGFYLKMRDHTHLVTVLLALEL